MSNAVETRHRTSNLTGKNNIYQLNRVVSITYNQILSILFLHIFFL